MPVVHQYKNRRGFYIKANQGGKITTYQVTKEGAAVLKGRGHEDGSSLSPAELARLREEGHVTTGGSGPGEMEPAAPAVPPPPPPTAPKKYKQSRRERKRLRQATWYGTSTPHAPAYSPPAWVPPVPPPPVPPPPLWVSLPDDTDEEWLVLPPLDPEPVLRLTEHLASGREKSRAESLPLDLTSPRNGAGESPCFPRLESKHRPGSPSPERSPVTDATPLTEPLPTPRPAAPGRDARQYRSPGRLPGLAGGKTPPRRGTEPAADEAVPRRPAEREEPPDRSAVKRWLALALAVLLVFPAWLLVAGLLALLFLPKDASLAVKAAAGVVVVGTAVGAAVMAYRSERE